eukprot:5447204-Pleurochrysis_carterae.AAC.4
MPRRFGQANHLFRPPAAVHLFPHAHDGCFAAAASLFFSLSLNPLSRFSLRLSAHTSAKGLSAVVVGLVPKYLALFRAMEVSPDALSAMTGHTCSYWNM